MVSVFPDIPMPSLVLVGQFCCQHFLYFCGSACFDCIKYSRQSTGVISEKISEKSIYFPFFQFPSITFSTFFLKFVIYLVILKVLLHFWWFNYKWWVYYRINGFKLTGMVQCNYSSLVILVNDAKYIHF